jgi:hypothetical protein
VTNTEGAIITSFLFFCFSFDISNKKNEELIMGGGISVEKLSEEEERLVLDYKVSAKSIADKMRELEVNGECGVVVMAGAGISVSAGIPGRVMLITTPCLLQ